MKEHQEALKKGLGHVRVNERHDQFWATATKDFDECLLKDLAREDLGELERNELGDVNICVSGRLDLRATIVTGRFRDVSSLFDSNNIGAGIWYTLHDRALTRTEFDELKVRHVCVYTPVVGRRVVDEEFVDRGVRLNRGESVLFKLKQRRMEHNGWINDIPLRAERQRQEQRMVIGDRMCTTIPIQEGKGHAAIKLSIEKIRGYQILLTILNSGFPVELHAVEIDVGERRPIPISFRAQAVEMLRYGFGHPGRLIDYRSPSSNGLEEIGMEGVEAWVKWWCHPHNKHLIDHWLQPDDEANPMATLEGLVRARSGKPDEKLWGYSKTLKIAMDSMRLGYLLNSDTKKDVAEALAEAHNHNKHIGRWSDHYFVVSRFATGAKAFMSFLVTYGILAAGIGKDIDDVPDGLRNNWVRMIEECYKKSIEPLIPLLPENFGKQRSAANE